MQLRTEELPPVKYFHVVFTLPYELSALALRNKRVLYELLFRMCSQTLLEIAADPKHLGAQIGFICILHTWGAEPAAPSPSSPRYSCRRPGTEQVLLEKDTPAELSSARPRAGKVFRGKFLEALEAAFHNGELSFFGNVQHLAQPEHFQRLLSFPCDRS
jgi:hypothetical protein